MTPPPERSFGVTCANARPAIGRLERPLITISKLGQSRACLLRMLARSPGEAGMRGKNIQYMHCVIENVTYVTITERGCNSLSSCWGVGTGELCLPPESRLHNQHLLHPIHGRGLTVKDSP